MGCDCCKEVNPADYSKCKYDMERILRNRKPTSSKRYVAPCCESFTFGPKYTMQKRKKKRKIEDE